jgi:nuclear GTP-binding protein
MDTVAKSVINDFLRGRVPWFVPPPKRELPEGEVEEEAKKIGDGIAGRKGALGEMSSIPGMKRKRDALGNEVTGGAPAKKAEEDGEVEGDEEVYDDDDAASVSDSEAGDEFAGFEGADSEDEDADGEGGGVVLPTSLGNLDRFAEALGSEDEDEDEDGADDDTPATKKRKA